MSRAQRVSYRIGAIAAIVTSGFHLLGHFQGPAVPSDPKGRQLLELLRTYPMDLMGTPRTMSDLVNGFSLAFSLFLLILGLFGLILLRRLRNDTDTLRLVTALSVLASGGLLAISVTYWFPAPTICLAVTAMGYAGALLPLGKR